jgi:tetratricopeptide (TPR) repeat protein
VTRALFVFVLVLGAAAPALAQSRTLDGTFSEANAAYARGDYEQAATLYEQLVEAGVDDVDVYYDLGLCHARRGAHGRAVAAFERALRLDPRDTAALTALDASRATLGRRRAEREGEALVDTGPPALDALFGWASEDLLAMLFLILEALLTLSLAGLLVTTHERYRIALGIIAPLTALLLATTAVGLLARTGGFDPGPAAIVVREGASMREGPALDARERHQAFEGERVFITAEDGGFVRVETGSRIGWVDSSDLVRL